MDLRSQIAKWKEELLAPNKSDVLANLVEGKNAIYSEVKLNLEDKTSLPYDNLINRFYKIHRNSIKESGTPIFGYCKHLIQFELDHQNYSAPLFIASCSIKKNRINSVYDVQCIESFYVNPFVSKMLDINHEIDDIEDFKDWVTSRTLKINIKEGYWFANLHPHRFILVKELERLSSSDSLAENLKQIFGEDHETDFQLKLSEGELFDADTDQLKVFKTILEKNVVVQGPPGTGKSQVISNLMGKTLGNKLNALLVAEKKVALDVIYDKLKEHELHHFCLLHHHQLNAKTFVQSLKSTWEYLENRHLSNKPFSRPSKLAVDGLDLTLSRLKQDDLIGGISFSAFKKNFDQFNHDDDLFFSANVPEIPVWNNEKSSLKLLKERCDDTNWAFIRTSKNEDFVANLENSLKRIIALIEQINVPQLSRIEIEKMMQKSGIASLFFYDDLLISPQIFEKNSKVQKRFLKHYDKYITLSEECSLLEEEKKHWKKNFSLSELQEYISVLSSSSRFSLRSKFQRKKLLKFTDLNLNDAQATLENLINLKKKQEELVKIKQQLRKLGLSDDVGELNHVNYVIRKTHQVDENIVQELARSTGEQLNYYKSLSSWLNELNQLISHNLLVGKNDILKPIVQKLIRGLDKITQNANLIQNISDRTKQLWKETHDIEHLNKVIYCSHWKQFEGRFPGLSKINSKEIKKRIEGIIDVKTTEKHLFAAHAKDQIQQNFDEYLSLLSTPARKLNEADKLLKKELKKGKTILVNAFGKSRNFPSIYDLLNSDAKKWIQLIHPIFLCSPYSVAKSIPINLIFDLVIFDEASQIPLPHAIGSLQRSKRVVVAGDQQQMAPHFYFQKNNLSSHDLLHQAAFYWDNLMLTNHYRSSHEQLIEYSNRYFYENKLTTFPKPEEYIPIKVIDTSGKFVDRVNKEEATAAAKEIRKYLANGYADLGIVAFSKSQLEAILSELYSEELDQLMDEDHPGFVQSLENVQGDQCATLIISMGYAPNENGDFHMRFGPLNQEQGHRRLNVLMSRAQNNIIFIRSVKANDFDISDNEGIEALRKLMLFLEQKPDSKDHQFKNGVSQKSKNLLEIDAPQETFSSANALINYYNVMSLRGWEIDLKI